MLKFLCIAGTALAGLYILNKSNERKNERKSKEIKPTVTSATDTTETTATDTRAIYVPTTPTPTTKRLKITYLRGELDFHIRDKGSRKRKPLKNIAINAYVFYMFVPSDHKIDFGPDAWKDKEYRNQAVRSTFIVNWATLKPSLIGGRIKSEERTIDGMNREIEEEIGSTNVDHRVAEKDYIFTQVIMQNRPSQSVSISCNHYFCKVFTSHEEEQYMQPLRNFYMGGVKALKHELFGILDVPLSMELPKLGTPIWDTGTNSNLIGLPNFLRNQLQHVAEPLLLALVTSSIITAEGAADIIEQTNKLCNRGRPMTTDKFFEHMTLLHG